MPIFVEEADAGDQVSCNSRHQGSTRGLSISRLTPALRMKSHGDQKAGTPSWGMGPGLRAQSHICCLEGAMAGWVERRGLKRVPGEE